MQIQTKPVSRTLTARVKCIVTHPNYPDVLICLYTGEIRVIDPKTYLVKKTSNICNVPIRTAVIIPSKDCILIGNDDGDIIVLDLGNLNVLNTIKAHDDFIRKIKVDEINQRILTVSDDNRTKLWSYGNSPEFNLTLINKYKDAKHFVMDCSFFMNEPNYFLTVSLDKKIRMYSVSNVKVLKTYKGHSGGINCLIFINSETFVTGSDDNTLMVWDIRRLQPILVLQGHSKNVNSLQLLKNGFSSCSEDNTVRIWSKEFKSVEILNLQGRVWDLNFKNSKLFVGSDEEFCIFEENGSFLISKLVENKLFYNTGSVLKSAKIEEIGAFKELGELEKDFEDFKISPNGKLIAISGNGKITINSTLGMRRRYQDEGKDVFFTSNDEFIYLTKDSQIFTVEKNEIKNKMKLDNIISILYCDDRNRIIVNRLQETASQKSTPRKIASRKDDNDSSNTSNQNDHLNDIKELTFVTELYEIDSDQLNLINQFTGKSDFNMPALSYFNAAFILDDYFLLCNDKISIFNEKFDLIEVLDYSIESYCISQNVLYFTSSNKCFYLLINDNKAFVFPMKYQGKIVGVFENFILNENPTGIFTKNENLDFEFINFKQEYFKNNETEVSSSFREKAIGFFELLGLNEKALSLAVDENQKFEILIKLGKLEEALKIANSPIKFEKLGKKFIKLGQLSKAADCYSKSNDLESLFLIDLFGERKYLDFVSKVSLEIGKNNLAFLAFYKLKNYKKCGELLKNTEFHEVFNKFYE
jgi:coatomer subunit beta'